jgi:Flp pilus assembly protein TadG
MKFPHKFKTLSDRCGSVAIEYGIIIPVMMLFFVVLTDVGLLLWTYTTLQRAAEAAARCGAVSHDILATCGAPTECVTNGDIQNKAVSESWGLVSQRLRPKPGDFTVTMAPCGLQVSVNYTYPLLTPWTSSLILTPRACSPIRTTAMTCP